jgi:uncharacterized protein (TIGR03437 family)
MRGTLLTLVLATGLLLGQVNPTITSVLDPYTGSTNLAPGGLAVISGSGLGTNPRVTVGGKVAYSLTPPIETGGTRISIEIPVDAPVGASTVVVSPANTPSPPFPVTLGEYAPVLIASTSGGAISPIDRQSGVAVTAGTPAAPGDTVVLSAIGLGPTNPAVATGTPAPANVSTTGAPAVTLGNNVVPNAVGGLAQGQIGIGQVTFTVPAGTPAGSYPVSISIGGMTSNSITLAVGPPPTGPAIASVLDAVMAGPRLCPGGLAILSGLNFGGSPQVAIGDKSAYVMAVNGNQATIEIPVDAAVGDTNVVVTRSDGQTSAPFSISLAQYAPVLYSAASGATAPIHQNTGLPVTASNPALPNETIVVFGIGLGPTNPVVPTGTPAPADISTETPPRVMLTSQTPLAGATASLVPGKVGLYQIEFPVPASPPTGNPFLWIEMGSGTFVSSNYLNLPTALTASPPSIDELSNNYSYIVPGLPNYGIAQGSIFDIFGANLSNVLTGLQSVPLGTSLGGTTVDVMVNGTTTHALLYYASPLQIVAILPSATPVGDGTITVSNGLNSGSAPIHVVQSAFGILTLNGAGVGPAAAFDVNYQYLGLTNALNPGDYFILWGTGVGPVSGDESITQTPTDLTSVPFSIEVGGLQAQLVYHGRSQYPGLDQVIGIVPAGVQPGCWVSVTTRSGNIVSNFATLPVAASGRTCSDDTRGLSATQVQTLMAKSEFHAGVLEFLKQGSMQSAAPGNITVTDNATAEFLMVKPSDFASAALGPSIGSCQVIQIPYGGNVAGGLAATPLDAGPQIEIAGPNRTADITPQSGTYSGTIGGAMSGANQPLFISNSGGDTLRFDNGTGGVDVSAFTTSITMPTPLLSWPDRTDLNRTTVSRSGLAVTWTNAAPNGFIQVGGRSFTAGDTPVGAGFTCAVPVSATQFDIPESVLLSLPVSNTDPAVEPALAPLLWVSRISLPQPFDAGGLDFATIQETVQIVIAAYYQ